VRTDKMNKLLAEADDMQPTAKVAFAGDMLAAARELLKQTNHPRAVERVRLALTSCQGAERHERSRSFRHAA
jgi:hypothetical protein